MYLVQAASVITCVLWELPGVSVRKLGIPTTPKLIPDYLQSVPTHRVAILVLGDLGRSPRMQYHARSLADAGAAVDLVGYAETELFDSVENHPMIRVHPLRRTSASDFIRRNRLLFVLHSVTRVLQDTIQLTWALLFGLRRPDTVLVQNPPSAPTLLVALVVARLRSARYVIDWHNYGYSMVALRLGQRSPLVSLHQWLERTCGGRADPRRVQQSDRKEAVQR